ncbi:MAG TPA: hypothetical protein VEG44_09605 [Candidatus Acidoferrales bacterium]|nr:hypothetical protein [Candidatus Acidoferrales bacterium]
MRGNGKKPWQRLPDETVTAYRAFCIFLNLGSQRSLSNVAQEIDGRTTRTGILKAWAVRFDWTARAELCDQYIEEEFSVNTIELSNYGYDFDKISQSPRAHQKELVYLAQRGQKAPLRE